MKRFLLLPVFFFFITLCGQTVPTALYGDFNGYWFSKDNTNTYVTTNDNNNLIGFTQGSVTYSTGVNNAILTSHGISFSAQNYKAFPISITNSSTSGALIGIPKNMGGVVQDQTSAPTIQCSASLNSWMRDGTNGLNIATAIFNIQSQSLTYLSEIINPTLIADDIPDIIVTQVGQPSATVDKFKFVNSVGALIGSEININFNDAVPPRGRALWAFYNTNSCPYPYSTSVSGTRDTRVLTFKLSDFGITAANYTQVAKFVQTLSGASDVAFSAYNTQALSLYCLENPTTAGVALPTKIGVTAIGRAGSTDSDNWPMVRNGGWIALESNKKPFVPTRIAKADLGNITNPQEGMMVYDTTDQCLKIYVNNTVGWKCYNKKTCP